MIGAIVSILLTVLFLKQYGVIVVAISTMIGYYIIWLIRRVAVNKYLNIGVSPISTTMQVILLVVESVFVGKGAYLWAMLCFAILTVLNFSEIVSIVRFAIRELNHYIHRKLW